MTKRDDTEHALAGTAESATLPAWDQLPDIDLYMDQVISLMTRYLGSAGDEAEKPLTASMVNNYVKTGLVPPPEKKRYTRMHLAYLAIVCTLKPVLPLSSIRALLERELAAQPIEPFYEQFRKIAEDAARQARSSHDAQNSPALRAALRAQAERKLAVTSYR